MTTQNKINLSHLTKEEVEILYQRYLRENTNALLKEYNLKISLSSKLFGLFPEDRCDVECEFCGEKELFAKKVSKTEFNSRHPITRIAQCKCCDHRQYVSDDLSNAIKSVEIC